MGAVYGNAFITITAAGAEDCQRGIFFPRSPNRGMPFRFLAMKYDNGECEWAHGYLYFDRWFSRFSLSDDEPVDNRAWTLQERLLSPRVIKYGKSAVSWECRSRITSEFDATIRTGSLKVYLLPPRPTVDHWMRTVEDYSSRALTFSTDRVPALLGVTQKFQESLEQIDYAAGLWHSPKEEIILLRLLLWHTVVDTPARLKTAERLPGPTWSWTSVSLPVSWRYPPVIPFPDGAELELDMGRDFDKWHAGSVDCRIEMEGNLGPLGRAKQGHITARGVVKQILALVVEDGPLNRLFIVDAPVDSDAKKGIVQFDLTDDNPFAVPDGASEPEVMIHGASVILPSCLYLADARVRCIVGNVTVPCGLLISPVATSPGQWRKVGVFALVDCESFTETETGWLDDGVEMEFTLV